MTGSDCGSGRGEGRAGRFAADRRQVIRGGAAMLGVAAMAGLAGRPQARTVGPAVAAGRDLLFDVSRDERPIGTHEIRFARDGSRLEVEIRIELEVELLFLTAFRYSHRNRELWEGGRLVAISTATDDNGTDHRVQGRLAAEGFVIETAAGRAVRPAGLLPSSWWHPDTVGRSHLLNTQDGKVMEVRMTPGGMERVPGDGGTIPARLHACRGDLDLDLWRDQADRLARIRFTAPLDGSVIDYRRRPVG